MLCWMSAMVSMLLVTGVVFGVGNDVIFIGDWCGVGFRQWCRCYWRLVWRWVSASVSMLLVADVVLDFGNGVNVIGD